MKLDASPIALHRRVKVKLRVYFLFVVFSPSKSMPAAPIATPAHRLHLDTSPS
jgi:hypothetical protein